MVSDDTRARHAREAVARFPTPRLLRLRIGHVSPTRRSLAVAIALLAVAAAAYGLARETAIFAIRTIDVQGAPANVARQVRGALAPLVGSSLVKLDGDDVRQRLTSLPVVASATYDRAFPHTLRVFVRAERPLAVVRHGSRSWLVSVRGRVMARLPARARMDLPRIWAGRAAAITPGEAVTGDTSRAARALAMLRPAFRRRIRTAAAEAGKLTLVLRSGAELRLGGTRDLRLKAEIARRVLATLPAGAGSGVYLDLAVPARPVVGSKP